MAEKFDWRVSEVSDEKESASLPSSGSESGLFGSKQMFQGKGWLVWIRPLQALPGPFLVDCCVGSLLSCVWGFSSVLQREKILCNLLKDVEGKEMNHPFRGGNCL